MESVYDIGQTIVVLTILVSLILGSLIALYFQHLQTDALAHTQSQRERLLRHCFTLCCKRKFPLLIQVKTKL